MRALSQVKPALLFLLLVCTSATASPLADSVLRASPVDAIVAQYPAMMSQGVREGLMQSGRVEPFVANAISSIVSSSFSVAEIRAQVVDGLDQGLSDQQLDSVLAWYETPLARKITQEEIAASRPATWEKVEAAAADLQDKYAGSERAKLFDRFDRAARATESAVDTTVAVQLGLASAMAAFNGSKGPSFEQLQQKIESQRGMLRGMVSQQVYGGYLYTYQDLSTSELKDYIEFLESDAGSAFTRVVTNSIQRSITDPVESVGSQLVRFFNPG
ncbi:DUF2059 domain-containing protein [Marinobacter orientalis]|uniref:DUF2059 domain-containing protein n=1 Tax=Marinobacter orientalis TaxID=1928859 RepID=A0A7Y0WT57_9GAMM|nr:DUF2059 domain-containing protein [Marinobacter orientalis]NMT64497.1 DUF2059 domain-containing protein [Marinobacter orientalis]TGX50546.1 DUF2059 domain-containing protein [Marinobacter orientalis]